MTSILKKDDKIFIMYRQYKALIHKDAEENGNHVYGTDQLAAQLTVAHMLDHVVCLIKENKPVTAKKMKKAPQTLLETFDGEIDWRKND